LQIVVVKHRKILMEQRLWLVERLVGYKWERRRLLAKVDDVDRLVVLRIPTWAQRWLFLEVILPRDRRRTCDHFFALVFDRNCQRFVAVGSLDNAFEVRFFLILTDESNEIFSLYFGLLSQNHLFCLRCDIQTSYDRAHHFWFLLWLIYLRLIY
jgi:hypothetical protein